MARILVIEDDRLFSELMSRALERRGHEVSLAGNGAQALQRCAVDQFDLVVCDLVMPERDGIEVIRSLRAATREVRILAVSGGIPTTAGGNINYLKAAEALGADAVLEKPFLPTVFADLVDNLLSRPPTGRVAAQR